MTKPITTKSQLLERIAHGPASIELLRTVSIYRVAVPQMAKPDDGVRISLSDENRYVEAVHARANGREVMLTLKEASCIAQLVAFTMRLRRRPWKMGARRSRP